MKYILLRLVGFKVKLHTLSESPLYLYLWCLDHHKVPNLFLVCHRGPIYKPEMYSIVIFTILYEIEQGDGH